MPDPQRKSINNKATRNNVVNKMKEALKSKPTASSLARQGLPTEELNRIISHMPADKRKTIPNQDRIVRNGRAQRFPSKPTHAYHQIIQPTGIIVEPIPLPPYALYPTPDWFTSEGKADVSIIIPLWKSEKVVIDQINSWDMTDDGLKKEIIYVEDACPHNSKSVVLDAWQKRKLFKSVGKIVTVNENAGYGRACNIGAKVATGDYLIFLNSDTTVTKDWVRPIIAPFKDPTVGVVGNLQLKEGGQWHGTVDSAGSEWCWQTMQFEHIARNSYRHQSIPSPFKPEMAPADALAYGEREMVTGCCFAMKKEMFDYVGGFDHGFRIGYWEDADLCMRIREEGYKVVFTPDSVIWHKLSSSGVGGHPFMKQNINYFMNKWGNSGRLDDLVAVPRPGGKPVVTHILVKRFGANGDVYMASGVLPALKKKYPHAKIAFCTACREVVLGNPNIDLIANTLAEVDLSIFKTVINLDLAYEYHPNWSIRKAFCTVAGISEEDWNPWIRVGVPTQHLPTDYVVIHPRSGAHSGWVGKNWKLEYYKEIVSKLKQKRIPVVSVGTGGDWDVDADIDLRGKTKVPDLAAVMKNAKFFIGADSFPMHIANHFGVAGAVFFGAVNPNRILDQKASNLKAIQAENLDCLGCHHTKPVPCVGTDTCNRGDLACEDTLTADYFWDKMVEIISKKRLFGGLLGSAKTLLPVLSQ